MRQPQIPEVFVRRRYQISSLACKGGASADILKPLGMAFRAVYGRDDGLCPVSVPGLKGWPTTPMAFLALEEGSVGSHSCAA